MKPTSSRVVPLKKGVDSSALLLSTLNPTRFRRERKNSLQAKRDVLSREVNSRIDSWRTQTMQMTANSGGNGKTRGRERRARKEYCSKHSASDVIAVMGGGDCLREIIKELKQADTRRGMRCPVCAQDDKVRWLTPPRVALILSSLVKKRNQSAAQRPTHQVAVTAG